MSKPASAAHDLLRFIHASPSPFHAVAESRKRLLAASFTEISERASWSRAALTPAGKYFFTRNGSTIIAFVVGGKFKAGEGLHMIGAHTDSPCFKLKPVSKKEKTGGYLSIGVQPYGGGIWASWFDRDLGIAGRIMVEAEGGELRQQLVRIDKPIMRIPTLAIHLDRTINEDFKFNKETHLTPVLGLVSSTLNKAKGEKQSGRGSGMADELNRHHSVLLDALATEAKIAPSQIRDLELCLYDIQPPTLGGIGEEFVFSARLDNLASSFASLTALIETADAEIQQETNVRMVAVFDNEEVGSESAYGAASSIIETTMRRIQASMQSSSGDSAAAFEEGCHKSFLVSADMAHAVHPNYPEKHEDDHRPLINAGVVIKRNANQRYATTAATAIVIRELARKHAIPVQEFVIRNDSACGSTIGPILSTRLGVRTVDVGAPQLSMHSCREMGGAMDVQHAVDLYKAFFTGFSALDAKLFVD